jgi:hypothetical protein
MDNVKQSDVIDRWIENADFYSKDVLPLVFTFDSIEELLEKGMSTDYQSAMNKAEEQQQATRENIVFGWEQVLQGLNE